MQIENVSSALNDYLKENKFTSPLLSFGKIGMLACAVLAIVNNFISLGTIVSTLAFYAFVVFALMVFAQEDFKALAMGLALYSAPYLLTILRGIFRGYLSWGSLVHFLVYLGLAFLAYKKSGGTVDELKDLAKKGVQTASDKVNEFTAPSKAPVTEAPVAEEAAVEAPVTEEAVAEAPAEEATAE